MRFMRRRIAKSAPARRHPAGRLHEPMPVWRPLLLLLVALPVAAREVAVTFDDLPDLDDDLHSVARQTEIIRSLAAQLRAQHVPAIGFVNEEKLYDDDGDLDDDRVALLRLWHDAGLALGNHTFSHARLADMTVADYTCDIDRGDEITRTIATRARWFRHPYLETGRTLAERDAIDAFLATNGYQTAPVTIDDSDWIFDTAYDVARHWWQRRAIRRAYLDYMARRFDWAEYESRIVCGRDVPQILLLHASALNADTFAELAQLMRNRGYTFVSIDEAVSDSAYELPDTWTGGGVGWLERWGVTAGIDERAFEGDPQVPDWVQRIAHMREP
jgi:peptidoglycan/xylan/chitin deacetylase (PgdA/CDA1 family)